MNARVAPLLFVLLLPFSSIGSAAEPRLGGIWIEPAAIAMVARDAKPETLREVVRQSMTTIAELKVRVVILAYAEYFGTFYYTSQITFFDRDVGAESRGAHAPADLYSMILEEADRHGLEVYLGIGRQGDTNLLWEFDQPEWSRRLESSLRVARQVATELHARFKGHPSFVGWYLSHEMADLARSRAYYDPLAEHCHQLHPKSRVLISPAGTPILTKEEIAQSKVDIFAYQDAVGAGYVPYKYTYDPKQRIAQLEEAFKKYARLHEGTGKEIWANVELWEMDGSQGYSGAYPASFERLRQQMIIEAPHVSLLTGYAWHGYMQENGNGAEKENSRAQKLLSDYRSYLDAFAR